MEDTRNVIDKYKGMPLEDIAKDLAKKALPLHIAIENYQHDYNIGTIVRSANAFNVAGVHIVGKRHWNRRGAMATEKYLQIYHHKSVQELANWSKYNSLEVFGIDNIAGSVPLHKCELDLRGTSVLSDLDSGEIKSGLSEREVSVDTLKEEKHILAGRNTSGEPGILSKSSIIPKQAMLVFGQEGPGLSEEMQAICTKIIAIEQFGSTRSINLGVAAGIIMYEYVRLNYL